MNHSTEIGTGNFVAFFLALKHFEKKLEKSTKFQLKFYDDNIPEDEVNPQGKSVWDLAMERVDKDTLDTAWDSVLRSINAVAGETIKDKVHNLFKDFDSDGTGELDLTELGAGLESCGIRLNERQTHVLAKSIDKDGDGNISFDEFAVQVQIVKKRKAEEQVKEDEMRMGVAIDRVLSNKSDGSPEGKGERPGGGRLSMSMDRVPSFKNGILSFEDPNAEKLELFAEKKRLETRIRRLQNELYQAEGMSLDEDDDDDDGDGVHKSSVKRFPGNMNHPYQIV
jgi:hypothetical protein